jgi:omega-hydroxy-beta-dihydromenaquinone-9 sulfotransferase
MDLLETAQTRQGRLVLAREALLQGLGTDAPLRPLLRLLSHLPHVIGPLKPSVVRSSGQVVVIGNPRTGSTMLQRLLVDLGVGVGPRLWQQLLPGGRPWKLTRPLLPLLRPIDPARFHNPALHLTGFDHVETDEIPLLAAEVDGLFAYTYFWSFAHEDWSSLVDISQRNTITRDLSLLSAHHAAISNFAGGARVVSRVFGLAPHLSEILEAWPDARLLFVLRDPACFIPSARSLVISTLAARLGSRFTPELQSRVGTRVEEGLIRLAASSADSYFRLSSTQRARVRLVSYDRLTNNIIDEVSLILQFVSHPLADYAQELLASRANAQRSYLSQRHYSRSSALRSDRRLEMYRTLLMSASTGFVSLPD